MKERKAELQKLIDFKKLKGASRKPRYATRKLTIGLVSCMLGFTLLVSPQSVEASEARQTEATDAGGAGSGKTDEPSTDVTPAQGENTTRTESEAEKQAQGTEADKQAQDSEKPADGQTGQAEGKQEPQEAPVKADPVKEEDEEDLEEYKAKSLKKIEDLLKDLEEGTAKKSLEEYKNDLEQAQDKERVDEIVKAALADNAALAKQNEGLEISDNNNPEDSRQQSSKSEEAIPENRKPKTNWDEEAGKGDERNWPVDISGGQRLVRVRTTEPTQITDLNYDGTYTNADGRDSIKLLYKEKTQAASGVWYRICLLYTSDAADDSPPV